MRQASYLILLILIQQRGVYKMPENQREWDEENDTNNPPQDEDG
jgi:hypothetical protein